MKLKREIMNPKTGREMRLNFLFKSWKWFTKRVEQASVTADEAINTSKLTGRTVHLFPGDRNTLQDYIYELSIAATTMTVRQRESTFVGAGWTIILHYQNPSDNG